MSPSMQNGIVGLKPTIGLVSRQGIIPISTTLDTAGPMAKTVYDCALLLSAIRGNDQKDVVTLSKEEKRVDYTSCLETNTPNNLRVLVDKTNLDKLSKKRQDAYKNVIKTLKNNGVTIIEDIPIKQTKSIYQIMIYEFKRAINSYLSNEDIKDIQSLKDIINYNINHEKEALKYGQVLLEEAEYNTSGRCFEKEYIDALKERSEARDMLKELFTKHNLDAIYFATYTSLAPHTGFPSMTVPVGLDENNIPIGTYLLGNEFKEESLLQVAHVIEQNIQGRTNPLKDNETLHYAKKDI
jgi:amidase